MGVSLKVGTHVPCEHIPEDHNIDLYHSDKFELPDVILLLRLLLITVIRDNKSCKILSLGIWKQE